MSLTYFIHILRLCIQCVNEVLFIKLKAFSL